MTNRWALPRARRLPFSLEESDHNEQLRNANDSPSLERPEEEITLFAHAKPASATQLPHEPTPDTAPKPHRPRRAVRQIAGIEYAKMQAISEKRKGSSKELRT